MAMVPRRTRMRGNRNMFSVSDDSALTKQIVATHAPVDGHIDVRPLLDVVQDIFNRAASAIPAILQRKQAPVDANWDDNALLSSDLPEILDILSHTINKISCEISCKCSGGVDAHATAMGILGILSSYSWDAKVVAALAAFAVNFGEFWLVAQLYATNPLAKAVAMLKQLPEMLEAAEALSQKYDAIRNLVKAMLDVANCIVHFEELPSQYISPDTPQMLAATAYIPVAAYWIIRSVVICASQISGIIGKGQEYIASTTETWELSSLAHKVDSIHNHLLKQLELCYKHIDDNKHLEAFRNLAHLFEIPHTDNLKILRALIYNKDDQLPLLDGLSKNTVSIEVLKRKIVLLLITDLDLSNKELFILEQRYSDSRQISARPESQYEMVWLPVVDRAIPWNEEKENKFLELQSKMPWYSIYHPSLLEPATVRYIKEVWRFNKKPMLVVLDPFGKVVNLNAIYMMLIWGSVAYPFTAAREEELWQKETWRLELLVDAIDPSLYTWMSEERSYICLYGGENLEWIRRLTKSAKAMAEALQLPLEMMYMGKSNPGEKVRKNHKVIIEENLSHILSDGPALNIMWLFWVRLESMWQSKLKQGMTAENDPIMQEIMMILTYDGSDEGWVVICKGADPKMARGKGEPFQKVLDEYEKWKDRAQDVGPLAAMEDHMKGMETPHHCNRLILPESSGGIPEKVVCAECGRSMEKFFMYRCCTD